MTALTTPSLASPATTACGTTTPSNGVVANLEGLQGKVMVLLGPASEVVPILHGLGIGVPGFQPLQAQLPPADVPQPAASADCSRVQAHVPQADKVEEHFWSGDDVEPAIFDCEEAQAALARALSARRASLRSSGQPWSQVRRDPEVRRLQAALSRRRAEAPSSASLISRSSSSASSSSARPARCARSRPRRREPRMQGKEEFAAQVAEEAIELEDPVAVQRQETAELSTSISALKKNSTRSRPLSLTRLARMSLPRARRRRLLARACHCGGRSSRLGGRGCPRARGSPRSTRLSSWLAAWVGRTGCPIWPPGRRSLPLTLGPLSC